MNHEQEDNMIPSEGVVLKRSMFALSKNPTIYNMIRWFAGLMGQMTRRPSVVTFQVFFFIISYRLRALKTLYFHFCNFIKKNKKN